MVTLNLRGKKKRWRLAQHSFVQSSDREQRGQAYGRSTQRATICRSAFSVVRKSQTCGGIHWQMLAPYGASTMNQQKVECFAEGKNKCNNVFAHQPKGWLRTKENRKINWQQWLSSVMDVQKVDWTWDTVMFMCVGDPNKQAVQTWCCKPPESFYSEKKE